MPEGIDLDAACRASGNGSGSKESLTASAGPVILSVPRQYRRKNTIALLRAMPFVRSVVPGATLRVIGSGPELARLQRERSALDLEASVELLGELPTMEAVKAEYRRADVFCLPSLQEGFGIVFLEAMAAGLPIVALRTAAIPEVVPDGETGLLVNPDRPEALREALIRLLRDHGLRAAMGRPARSGRRPTRGPRWCAAFCAPPASTPDGPSALSQWPGQPLACRQPTCAGLATGRRSRGSGSLEAFLMGEKDVRRFDRERRRVFTNKILRDVEALEQMLASGAIESGVRRIGVEQEMFLVDENWHPASKAIEVLERLDDPRVTHELALFNLEFNLDPIPFGGDCLRRLEAELASLLETVEHAAAEVGTRIILTGILPTLQKSDLTLENMTPEERYFALSAALDHLRGGTYKFYLKGVDELLVEHETMMLEAANTSFQVHFQVGAAEFARLYNIALVAAAPALAVAAGSPLLFGKRLWRETRIALFQQSIDTPSARPDMREIKPRVHFGTH